MMLLLLLYYYYHFNNFLPINLYVFESTRWFASTLATGILIFGIIFQLNEEAKNKRMIPRIFFEIISDPLAGRKYDLEPGRAQFTNPRFPVHQMVCLAYMFPHRIFFIPLVLSFFCVRDLYFL